MSLKSRQEWAYHVAMAQLVKCVKEDEGKAVKWTVPSQTNTSGMEFHTVIRKNGHFICFLSNPLGNGDPCLGNRNGGAGVCKHVLAVCTAEMLAKGRRPVFWRTEEEAEKQNRPSFKLCGEGGCVWVTHRKVRGG